MTFFNLRTKLVKFLLIGKGHTGPNIVKNYSVNYISIKTKGFENSSEVVIFGKCVIKSRCTKY